MTRRTYTSELDRVLEPLGFQRIVPPRYARENDWQRVRGNWLECVDLQFSSTLGTTANLNLTDLVLSDLFKQAMPARDRVDLAWGSTRIGALIDGHDRWWRQDPQGPVKLAEAVATYAPAFFDKQIAFRSERLDPLDTKHKEWSRAPDVIFLAMRLYRQGDRDAALKVLDWKVSKFTPKPWLDDLESVRRWMGCPPRSEPASGPKS